MKLIYRFSIRFLFICIFAHLHICTQAQDSSRIRISLLTCTPGDELYSTFGHSALRLTDSNSVTDLVYNYGTFNFDEKDFYLKFIQGRLKYFLSIEDFQDFKNDYIADHRGITEQVLNFSAEEKIAVRGALIENLKEENRYYLYDFFLDNCTTRLRDIIVQHHHPAAILQPVMPVNYSFRDALHQYLNKGSMPWSRLGIDILLGASADEKMTAAQQEFLPDNLMHGLNNVRNTGMVSSVQDIYSIVPRGNKKVVFSPFVIFCCLFLLFVLLSISKNNAAKRILSGFDSFLFFAVGLLGALLLTVWLITDFPMLKNNYNLLWAWPIHIVYAFMMHRDRRWVKLYSLFLAVFLVLLLISWPFLAQSMDTALIPIVLLMIWRGSKAFRTRNTQ